MKRLLIPLVALAWIAFAGEVKADDRMMERMVTAMERLEARIARLESQSASRSSYSAPSSQTYSSRGAAIRPASYSVPTRLTYYSDDDYQRQVEREVAERAQMESLSFGSSCGLRENEGVWRYKGYRVRFVIDRE